MIDLLKKTPPPIYFVACFAVGFAIDILAGKPRAVPSGVSVWLGVSAIAVSIGLIVPTLVQFRRAQTPFDVQKAPTALVTTGVFRFSRNPGYMSLSLLYVAVGVLLNSMTILAFFLPCFVVVDRLVIPGEEANLQASFGEQYLAYKRRVRRWI